jgi:cytochrome b
MSHKIGPIKSAASFKISHFTTGKPGPDMGFNLHKVRAYILILTLFLQLFWEAYTSQKPHFFRHPI